MEMEICQGSGRVVAKRGFNLWQDTRGKKLGSMKKFVRELLIAYDSAALPRQSFFVDPNQSGLWTLKSSSSNSDNCWLKEWVEDHIAWIVVRRSIEIQYINIEVDFEIAFTQRISGFPYSRLGGHVKENSFLTRALTPPNKKKEARGSKSEYKR